MCRDDAIRKAEEASAEAASSRQQISAGAESAASLRSKMESLRTEADAARQVSFPLSPHLDQDHMPTPELIMILHFFCLFIPRVIFD